MIKLLILILSSTILLFMISCRKYTMKTNVEGTVVDFTTGNSIPYAKVEIYAETGGGLMVDASSSGVLYSTDADINGNFSFEFKANKEYSYSVSARKDNYFFYDYPGVMPDNIYVNIENAKNNKNIKVKLKPIAWLKLLIKNTNNYWNEISISAGNGGGHYSGLQVDTTEIIPVFGNHSVELVWWLYNNQPNDRILGSIYCPAFDTTAFNINY